MFVRAAALLGSLLIAFPSAGLAQDSPSVAVRIAKTDRWVKPFGTATGGGDTVTVRFFKYEDDAWRLRSSDRVPVGDDGTYDARFRRPDRGECRVVVRYSGVRDEEGFPCWIPNFGEGTAVLTSLPATTVEIDALIAENNRQRGYGLMYRPFLRDDLGMPFLWDHDVSGGFWMKNTLIPLSIAFFDSNGTILRILDMEPCVEEDCTVYNPEVTYRGALEVNQGAFETWGIDVGDNVEVIP